MKGRLLTTIGLAAVVGAIGIGTAAAAGPRATTPGWNSRADCPYATSKTPLRIHLQDGTGQNARPGAPLHLQDGTGPHGPWAGGR